MTTKEIFPHPLSVHNYLIDVTGLTGLYMESGILELHNFAPLNSDSYRPATLHYDSGLSSYSTQDDALMGSIRVSKGRITYSPRDEGQSESSVGCKKLVPTASGTSAAGDTQTFNSAPPAFCADPDIQNRKTAQAFFPGSAFSGKMRMFIQAVYGSKRTDYSMNPEFGFLGGLTIDSYTLDPYSSTGYILYTGDDYTYYLLELKSSGVRTNKLDLSKAGEKLRQWLLDNPQNETETRRYEAYLLSTATFSSWHTIGSVNAYDSGSPFAYSWKSNFDGTIAHIVVYQQKEGTDNKWQTTHYSLTISLNEPAQIIDTTFWQESSRWTLTESVAESTQDVTFRAGEDVIYQPDYVNGGMTPFLSQPDALSDPTQINSDVPIYVIYDYENNQFDVLRYSRISAGTGVGALGGSHTDPSQYANQLCGQYNCGYYSNAATSAIQVGFYIDSGWDASGFASSDAVIDGNEVSVGDPSEFYGILQTFGLFTEPSVYLDLLVDCGHDYDHTQEGGGPTLELLDYIEGYSASSFGAELNMDGDFDYNCMAVLPRFDCDACYLGFWSQFSGEVDAGHTTAGSTVVTGCRLYLKDGTNITNGDIDVMSTTFPRTEGASFEHIAVKSAAQSQGKWVSVSNQNTDWDQIEVRLHRNGQDAVVYTHRSVSNQTVADNLIVPSCMNDAAQDERLETVTEAKTWDFGEVDFGGYEWTPVLYPIPEIVTSISAFGNVTDNWTATAKPGQTSIDDGGYDYSNLSSASFVGHD